MLPENDGLLADFEVKLQPSLTFKMEYEKETIRGTCDEKRAVEQAIFMILNVERYSCPLVSWNYGVEFKSLFGQPVSYCVPEIERRITEALKQDDRIDDVRDFSFSFPQKNVIAVDFFADTVVGVIKVGKEVSI